MARNVKNKKHRKSKKGGAFERQFSGQLSLWWSEGKRDDLFWRASTSGGRATQRAKYGKKTTGHYGDIAATDPEGMPLMDFVTIEMKRGYAEFTAADLFDCYADAKPQKFGEWVGQTVASFENSGSFAWWLIHCRDRREPMLWMPEHVFETLQSCPVPGIYYKGPQVRYHGRIRTGKTRVISHIEMIGVHLNPYLDSISPKLLRPLIARL